MTPDQPPPVPEFDELIERADKLARTIMGRRQHYVAMGPAWSMGRLEDAHDILRQAAIALRQAQDRLCWVEEMALEVVGPFEAAAIRARETRWHWINDGKTDFERRASEGERNDTAFERAIEELDEAHFHAIAAFVDALRGEKTDG